MSNQCQCNPLIKRNCPNHPDGAMCQNQDNLGIMKAGAMNMETHQPELFFKVKLCYSCANLIAKELKADAVKFVSKKESDPFEADENNLNQTIQYKNTQIRKKRSGSINPTPNDFGGWDFRSN